MSSSGGSNECRKSPESHSQPKSKSIKTQRKAIHRMQSEENNKESVTSTTEDHAPPGVRKDAAAEFLEFDDCVDVAAESVEVIVVTGEPVEEGFDVGVEAALFAVLDWPAAAVEEAPSVMRLLAVGAESALAKEDTSQFNGDSQEALR